MGNIVDITKKKPPISVGNKPFNLRKLFEIGLRIPKTYAVKWDTYQRYIRDDTILIDELKAEIIPGRRPAKGFGTDALR